MNKSVCYGQMKKYKAELKLAIQQSQQDYTTLKQKEGAQLKAKEEQLIANLLEKSRVEEEMKYQR